MRFARWIDKSIESARVCDLSVDHLLAYQKWLWQDYKTKKGRPLMVNTQRDELSQVRHFMAWLVEAGKLLSNPASALDLPRRTPPERNVFTWSEIERLMAEPDTSTAIGLRDRSMMETFYATGIRLKECCNLKVWDIDWQKQTLWIHEGKGGKSRVVPLGERALHWLKRYLEESRPLLHEGFENTPERFTQGRTDCLYLTEHGYGFRNDHFGKRLKTYMVQVGIHKRGGCHIFRRSMATHMLEQGANIRVIQAILGHAELNVTADYAACDLAALKRVHEACHPINQGGNRGKET